MTLSSGARLGPHEIQAAIGAGGMGEVYKAKGTRLDRTLVIKVLPAGAAGDPESLSLKKLNARIAIGMRAK